MLHSHYQVASPLPHRPIAVSVYTPEGHSTACPVVLFMHGFKGFKDWGHWAVIASRFVEAGYAFVAFNFSHNGTTLAAPTEFADLKAFGQNTFTKELADAAAVLAALAAGKLAGEGVLLATDALTVIGHSRGGPIALITALEHDCITRVVTWAGVHELNYRWENDPEQVETWAREGVVHLLNRRTQQQMPLYYSLYEDYDAHRDRLSIARTLGRLDKPYLIVHGTADPAVPESSAYYLHTHAQRSELALIKGANHVFGGQHPYTDTALPQDSQELVERTLNFMRQNG